MVNGKKVIVVLPAYNAAETLENTYREIPFSIVDEVILVDDASDDDTVRIARELNIKQVIAHTKNGGYGANQKTCYDAALSSGADIVIMVHPDYQYTPLLIPAMVNIIAYGVYQVVLGSRILGNGALRGGMPLYKYVANRFLTLFQNVMLGGKLSEYHTGYRAYAKEVLQKINYHANSDGFVFDNQVLSQIIFNKIDIAEVTCPTHYFPQASSINFSESIRYGLGVMRVSVEHFLQKRKLMKFRYYEPFGQEF